MELEQERVDAPLPAADSSPTHLDEITPFEESDATHVVDPDDDAFEESDATHVIDPEDVLARDASPLESADHEAPLLHAADLEEQGNDFQAQATEVVSSPFERDALAPKIRVVEGPASGQEFFITSLRVTLGRDDQNSIVLGDPSLSRQHCEILKDSEESYVARDLDSTNGLLLQGVPVEEVELFDGDRLQMGQTTLEFIYPRAPHRPDRHMIACAGETMTNIPAPGVLDDRTSMVARDLDRSTRFFTRVSLFAGLLCVPLCVLLIVASTSSPDQSAQPSSPAPTEAEVSNQNKAVEFYLQGVDAARDREWERAREHFLAAKSADDTLDITAQLSRIDDEIAAYKALTSAREAAEANEQERVLAIISTIPPESVYFDEAQRLSEDERRDEIAELYASAQRHVTDDDFDAAREDLATLRELVPHHKGAAQLSERITQREETLTKETARARAARRQARQREEETKAPEITFDAHPPTDTSPGGAKRKDLGQGYERYGMRDFDGAASFFEKRGGEGTALARHTRTVANQWSAGTKAVRRGRWGQAIDHLKKARRADGHLGARHRGAISKELAQAYGESGMDALTQKNYREARKMLTTGERMGSASSLRKLEQALERNATSLYIKAVNAKKSNNSTEAAKLCKTIMLMVPSSSQNYQKAKKLLIDL